MRTFTTAKARLARAILQAAPAPLKRRQIACKLAPASAYVQMLRGGFRQRICGCADT
jgi:hypothetical protein